MKNEAKIGRKHTLFRSTINALFPRADAMYWRFDEEIQHVELDYPRDLPSVWRGVPAGVDAAFRHTDGRTYFFRGDAFWRFDDRRMRVVGGGGPTPIREKWMRCGGDEIERRDGGDIR